MTARTNDLECWKLFCLVVEKQGLNAAADFADIEPSRLSRVINSLEAELGSPLLVHNRRPRRQQVSGIRPMQWPKHFLLSTH